MTYWGRVVKKEAEENSYSLTYYLWVSLTYSDGTSDLRKFETTADFFNHYFETDRIPVVLTENGFTIQGDTVFGLIALYEKLISDQDYVFFLEDQPVNPALTYIPGRFAFRRAIRLTDEHGQDIANPFGEGAGRNLFDKLLSPFVVKIDEQEKKVYLKWKHERLFAHKPAEKTEE